MSRRNVNFAADRVKSLSQITSSCICHYSACGVNSFKGSPAGGQLLWENIVAPEIPDSNPHGHGPLHVGTPLGTAGTVPTFTGLPGQKGAHFLMDGGDAFYHSGTGTVDGIDDVATGFQGRWFWDQDFTIMLAFHYKADGSNNQVIYSDKAGSLFRGMEIYIDTSGKLNVSQRGSSGATSSQSTNALTDDTDYVIFIDHDHSGNTTGYRIGTPVRDSQSHTFNTPTAGVTGPAMIGAHINFNQNTLSLFLKSGTKVYDVAMFNDVLTDEVAFDIMTEVTRYNGVFMDNIGLSLDFENGSYRSQRDATKAFLDIVTFSRSSAGTLVDENGVIQIADVDEPRFDWSTGRQGLLIEESRTNLVDYSNDPQNNWTQSSSSALNNQTTGPDGSTTGAAITVTAGTSTHYLYNTTTTSITSGTTYTLSLFAKAGTTNFIQLTGSSITFGFTQYANFQLTGSGSVTASSGGTAQIIYIGNGWYRISFSVAATATASSTPMIIGLIPNGSAGRTPSWTAVGEVVYIYGAQTEAGGFKTSYIPTYGSTATRAADVAKITGTAFSDWFNTAEGTLVLETNVFDEGSFRRMASFYASSSNYMDFQKRTSPEGIKLDVVSGGASQVSASVSGSIENVDVKSGFAYKQNDFAYGIDGSIGNDTSGNVPTVDTLAIGSSWTGAYTNMRIYNLTYYNTRLPDATLQELIQ